jgi:hypothetical protein
MRAQALRAPPNMQSVIRSSCRAGTGALRRIVCQAGSHGPALPPPEPLRRAFTQRAGLSGSSAGSSSSSSGWTGGWQAGCCAV